MPPLRLITLVAQWPMQLLYNSGVHSNFYILEIMANDVHGEMRLLMRTLCMKMAI